MQRIVINTCFGGFSLAEDAFNLYKAYAGISDDDKHFYDGKIERNDPILLQVIDQLGIEACTGTYAALRVIEIPDGVDWEIEEYDGKEHVAEAHRTWS